MIKILMEDFGVQLKWMKIWTILVAKVTGVIVDHHVLQQYPEQSQQHHQLFLQQRHQIPQDDQQGDQQQGDQQEDQQDDQHQE